jgi:hypothetical protein
VGFCIFNKGAKGTAKPLKAQGSPGGTTKGDKFNLIEIRPLFLIR